MSKTAPSCLEATRNLLDALVRETQVVRLRIYPFAGLAKLTDKPLVSRRPPLQRRRGTRGDQEGSRRDVGGTGPSCVTRA